MWYQYNEPGRPDFYHLDRILKGRASFEDIDEYSGTKGVPLQPPTCKMWWQTKGAPTPKNSPHEMKPSLFLSLRATDERDRANKARRRVTVAA